jgi:hypothetical protein
MLFPILFSINPNFRRLQSFQRLKQRHGGMEEGQLVDGNSWLQSRPKIVWGTGYIYMFYWLPDAFSGYSDMPLKITVLSVRHGERALHEGRGVSYSL